MFGWPQLIFCVLTAVRLCGIIRQIEKKKEDTIIKCCAVLAILTYTAGIFGLLYWGGFFS